jgi:hypothetical protein
MSQLFNSSQQALPTPLNTILGLTKLLLVPNPSNNYSIFKGPNAFTIIALPLNTRP